MAGQPTGVVVRDESKKPLGGIPDQTKAPAQKEKPLATESGLDWFVSVKGMAELRINNQPSEEAALAEYCKLCNLVSYSGVASVREASKP